MINEFSFQTSVAYLIEEIELSPAGMPELHIPGARIFELLGNPVSRDRLVIEFPRSPSNVIPFPRAKLDRLGTKVDRAGRHLCRDRVRRSSTNLDSGQESSAARRSSGLKSEAKPVPVVDVKLLSVRFERREIGI